MLPMLDETDRKILNLLRQDARMTNAAIGEQVGLTAPSVFERVKKMEKRGIIRGYTVRVDEAALGKKVTAFIRLTAAFDEKHDPGMRAVARDPDVLEFYGVAGEDCFLIKTKVCETSDLLALLNRIRSHMTITQSVTMIVLDTHKE